MFVGFGFVWFNEKVDKVWEIVDFVMCYWDW